MKGLIVSEAVSNGIKDTKIEIPIYDTKYKHLVYLANMQIVEDNLRYAKAYWQAERFISD